MSPTIMRFKRSFVMVIPIVTVAMALISYSLQQSDWLILIGAVFITGVLIVSGLASQAWIMLAALVLLSVISMVGKRDGL